MLQVQGTSERSARVAVYPHIHECQLVICALITANYIKWFVSHCTASNTMTATTTVIHSPLNARQTPHGIVSELSLKIGTYSRIDAAHLFVIHSIHNFFSIRFEIALESKMHVLVPMPHANAHSHEAIEFHFYFHEMARRYRTAIVIWRGMWSRSEPVRNNFWYTSK